MRTLSVLSPVLTIGLLLVAMNANAQAETKPLSGDEPMILEVTGRITDGDKKLPGCEVVVYDGNEVVGKQVTDKSGHFGLGLGLGKEFGIEFHKEGFVPKRILVDTRAQFPRDVIGFPELNMELSMLASSKYEGADTDALDFPFAIVRYDKKTLSFVQDQKYTTDMMRTNGALLLMAGRAAKN